MPTSTTKRVVLYRWDRQPIQAIVNPTAYLLDDRIEWITTEGRLDSCSVAECKVVCFVSENAKPDLFTEHNLFERRPSVPGLWTRFTFRDDQVLDGILPHNLLEWPQAGYMITPPQARGSRQRVFIPRLALKSTELRGVVGGPGIVSPKDKAQRPNIHQLEIFES